MKNNRNKNVVNFHRVVGPLFEKKLAKRCRPFNPFRPDGTKWAHLKTVLSKTFSN